MRFEPDESYPACWLRVQKLSMKSTSGLCGKRAEALVILSACGLLLALSGCKGRPVSANSSSQSQQNAPAGTDTASLFTIPAAQMNHLQIVRVEVRNLPNKLRLTGSVTYNNFETTPVITQVTGVVSRVVAFPGEIVHTGQPMLYVSSPQYAQMRSDYVKARDAYWLAQKNYSRAQDLYAHHAIAMRDLEQAQSAEEQAQADLTAAWQALKVLGLESPQEVLKNPASPEIPVLAPLTGEVVERSVSPGQLIQGGATQCFTISNMRTVWVLANVYQHDLAYIHLGDPVIIETDAYPMVFHGRISYIASALDPTTRTLQVRVVTQNPGQRLKKDMYVTVIVNAGELHHALTVPDSAVLRNAENQPFVYAVAGPQQFARRLVTIGQTQDGRTQILSGLSEGEQVVADGSLFLEFGNSFQH